MASGFGLLLFFHQLPQAAAAQVAAVGKLLAGGHAEAMPPQDFNADILKSERLLGDERDSEQDCS